MKQEALNVVVALGKCGRLALEANDLGNDAPSPVLRAHAALMSESREELCGSLALLNLAVRAEFPGVNAGTARAVLERTLPVIGMSASVGARLLLIADFRDQEEANAETAA